MANIVRMRTIKQAFIYLKKEDPESSISEYYLRCLVKQKKIPVFNTGVKFLINLDKLIDYLNSEFSEEENLPFNDYGKLRRISE